MLIKIIRYTHTPYGVEKDVFEVTPFDDIKIFNTLRDLQDKGLIRFTYQSYYSNYFVVARLINQECL